jgi:hypothetical protein
MSILEQGGNPLVNFSTDVVNTSKAKQIPLTTPSESAPLVRIPKIIEIIAKNKKIPLYTSPFGKTFLTHTANARGLAGETWTGLKHRFLARSLETNLHPDISVVNTEGLQVTISVPVTQFTGFDGTVARVREATENLLATGKYSRRPQLPPGENKKGKRTIPTPSAAIPSKVAIRENQLARDTDRYWPIAHITFQAGDESQALKLLHDKQMADLPQKAAGMLMPDVNLIFDITYVSKTGYLLESSLFFPLGQTAIQFDENGALIEDPNQINGLYFHPALRSLLDSCNLWSAKIFEATGHAATIDPKLIHQAALMAPKADKDTEAIIGPYIDRGRYVGIASRLLTQYPGELALGLCRVVNIVDKDGNPHPQATDISTGIMANILGFKDAPHPHGSTLTYIGLVSSLNQTLQDYDAYLEWAGNAKVVTMAVNRAGKMSELYALVEKLGISNAEQVAGEYRKTMTAGEFFGLALTPQIIGLSALTLLRIEHSQANIIKNEFLRIMGVLDTVDGVVVAETEANQKFWEGMLNKVLRDIKKLNPTKAGEAAAQSVINVLKDKYEKAKQNVIDVAASPTPESRL